MYNSIININIKSHYTRNVYFLRSSYNTYYIILHITLDIINLPCEYVTMLYVC